MALLLHVGMHILIIFICISVTKAQMPNENETIKHKTWGGMPYYSKKNHVNDYPTTGVVPILPSVYRRSGQNLPQRLLKCFETILRTRPTTNGRVLWRPCKCKKIMPATPEYGDRPKLHRPLLATPQ